MTKPDIMLTKDNLQQTVQSLLHGVQICSRLYKDCCMASRYAATENVKARKQKCIYDAVVDMTQKAQQ